MVKLSSLLEKKFYSIIISPNNITLLELALIKNTVLPKSKYEVEAQVFIEGEIDKNNLYQALSKLKKEIGMSNKEISAFIILNLPIFFIQKFIIQTYGIISLREVIENKIKQTLPINLSKYLWEYTLSNIQKDVVYVTFFNKENIYDITYSLIENGILPLKISHILYTMLDFIKNNFSLYYENSYQIFIINKNLLTTGIYEAGNLQNIYSEAISANIENILSRLIQNNVKNSNLPLDIIYISGDIDVEIGSELREKFKIVNLKEITHLSAEEISAINIAEEFALKRTIKSYEIRALNLNKELLLYQLTQSLRIFSLLTLLLFFAINGTIFGILKYIENYNKSLRAQTYQKEEVSYIEKIKELTTMLNQFNNIKKPFISKIEKIFYNLKDLGVNQAFFTENQAKFIIEIQDENKKNEIKSKIQQIFPTAQINVLYNGLEININNY